MNPQHIATTMDPRELAQAVADHHGGPREAARNIGMKVDSIRSIIRRGTCKPTTLRTLREHWCNLHDINLPDIDPRPVPEWLATAMRRYANEAGNRWYSLQDNRQSEGSIPTLSAAAAALRLPIDLIKRICHNYGTLTPEELDLAATRLEINQVMA